MSVTRWSAGFKWGPATTGPVARWEPALTAAAGDPHPLLRVELDGRALDDDAYGASWVIGRPDWFAEPTPGTGTIELRGWFNVRAGQAVRLLCSDPEAPSVPRALFTGTVTDPRRRYDRDEGWSTTFGIGDMLASWGQLAVREQTLPAGALYGWVDRINVYWTLSVINNVIELPALDAYPSLDGYTNTYSGTALAALAEGERSSNAIIAVLGDGTIVATTRSEYDGTPEALSLSGDDSPSDWSEVTPASSVINAWELRRNGTGADVLVTETAASVTAYGRRPMTIDALLTAASPYGAAIRAVLAEPRTLATVAVPVVTAAQGVHRLMPLGWVDYLPPGSPDDAPSSLWQVMQVAHQVDRDGWTVTLSLDRSQSLLAGAAEPDPDPPPEDGTVIVTLTVESDKSAELALTDGGSKRGAGAGSFLAVGAWDGWRYRALVDFPLQAAVAGAGYSWPDDVVEVIWAKLDCRTSTQSQVGFGADPTVRIDMIREEWTQGTEATPSVSNAVIWPGPAPTAVADVVKGVPAGEGQDWTADVTDQVQEMVDRGYVRGFRLRAKDEARARYTTELYSDDSANPPTLRVRFRMRT